MTEMSFTMMLPSDPIAVLIYLVSYSQGHSSRVPGTAENLFKFNAWSSSLLSSL